MAESHTTTDHEEIKNWAEKRGAKPSKVKGTGSGNDQGLLRLNFEGYAEDNLEEISWDDFFQKFDESNLALLYQDENSNFNKLVKRQ